jgi:thiol-disulfide isomerase/thioredoxin
MANRAVSTALVVALLPILGLAEKHTSYPPFVTSKTLYAKHDFRGKKAPAISAEKWLTGSLPKLKGKVILVDFWATWCPPCRETIPELGEWQKKFSKDLVVIGISDEAANTVSEFMKKTPMPYTVGVDSKKTMNNKLGVEGIPHVLVISADGVVRWQGFPLDDKDKLTTEKLEQIINASKGH